MKRFSNIKYFFGIYLVFFCTIFINASRVVIGDDLCEEEVSYIQKRMPFVQKHLEKFIGNRIGNKEYPKISFCLSGGGYRSMISCLGFMLAVEKIGLLSATTYMSALSGSSWLLIPFLARIFSGEIGSFEEYNFKLRELVNNHFFNPFSLKIKAIEKILKEKHKLRGKVELVDFWGALLTERLMGDIGENSGFDLSFKQIRTLLREGRRFPFPLFSASMAHQFPYHWLEVSPFAVYNDLLFLQMGGSIQTKAFGNVFENGYSECLWPEENLGFFMGILGSPYAMSVGDVLNFSLQAILSRLYKFSWLFKFENFFEKLHLYNHRISPTIIPNFSYGMRKAYFKFGSFELIDGGFKFNLPFGPLLRKERSSDIIIVCDASSDACSSGMPELELVKHYAKSRAILLPDFDNPVVDMDNLKIFADNSDFTIPTIIYFSNSIMEPTLEMDYPEEEFNKLTCFMDDLVCENKDLIVAAIKEKICLMNQSV